MAIWEQAQAEVQTLTRAVGDLKKIADKFTAQLPELEEKVKDGINKLHAKELYLKQTTKTNEDYKSHNAQVTKKLESKLSPPLSTGSYIFI
jgi:chromosome segregation ATPase